MEAVDGHPIEEVTRGFAGIIPHDNEAQVRDFVPRFLASSEHLLGLGLIASPDEAAFSVRTAGGEKVSVKMKSVPLAEIQTISWAAPAVDPARLPLYRRMEHSAYEYAYLPASRTLYFAYNSCRDLPGRPFAAFAEELWGAGGVRDRSRGPAVAPVPVRRVDPKIPDGVELDSLNGEVVLRVSVDDDGRVEAVEVLKSLQPEFDREMVRALKEWTFEPARERGGRGDSTFVMTFRFGTPRWEPADRSAQAGRSGRP